jgi:hypothetical protein
MVEYNASFTNPEAVSKIREAREKAIKVSSKEFDAGLSYLFGRSIGDLPKQSNSEMCKVDTAKAIESYNAMKKAQNTITHETALNYKHWLNSDLE